METKVKVRKVSDYIRDYCHDINSIGAEYISTFTMTKEAKKMGRQMVLALMQDYYRETDFRLLWDI